MSILNMLLTSCSCAPRVSSYGVLCILVVSVRHLFLATVGAPLACSTCTPWNWIKRKPKEESMLPLLARIWILWRAWSTHFSCLVFSVPPSWFYLFALPLFPAYAVVSTHSLFPNRPGLWLGNSPLFFFARRCGLERRSCSVFWFCGFCHDCCSCLWVALLSQFIQPAFRSLPLFFPPSVLPVCERSVISPTLSPLLCNLRWS